MLNTRNSNNRKDEMREREISMKTKIQDFRKEKGITQEQLAEILNAYLKASEASIV